MKKTRFCLLLFITIINFGCRKGHELVPSGKSFDAFPLFVQTNNNIKLYYRHGTSHAGNDGVIITRSSTDGGKSFSSPDTLLSDTGTDVRNVSGGVTPNNRIVLFVLKYNANTFTNVNQGYIYSDDEGSSWSAYQQLPTNKHSFYSPYGKLIAIGEGKLMQAWYGRGGPNNYSTYVTISKNNGSTWSDPIQVATSTSIRYCEASYAYLDNNVIIGLIRDDRWGAPFHQVISSDNGQTWSEQGEISFDSGMMVSPWLSGYTDANGKKCIMAFYANRTTNDLCAITGSSSGLQAGVAGWIPQSLKRLGRNKLQDFGYPSVITSGNGSGFGVYYKAYSHTSANLNFFTFTPSY